MASTYVNDLRLEEMATGDQSGTWGDTTNTNLELIAEAFSYGTEASFGSDADATTTIADGASDPARSLYLKITSGVSLTATRTLTIAPNTVSKIWIIENATSGSQSINISQGSGANVTIPNGDVKVIYTDGAGSGAAVVDAFTDLNLSGTTTVAALDAGSGAITTTGTVTGGTLAGTLSTAAQPNITSVGTLTGLDVTGTVTADGLTVDGNGTINGTTPILYFTESDTTDLNSRIRNAAGNFQIQTSNDALNSHTTRFNISNSTGDISFYDDTGTSQALYWDASAESLGIGTTSPNALIEAKSSAPEIRLTDSVDNSYTRLRYEGSAFLIEVDDNASGAADSNFRIQVDGTEAMRIDSSGNVGIGTSSPDADLHVYDSDGDCNLILETGTNNSQLGFGDSADNFVGKIQYNHPSNFMAFNTNGSEKMRVDSSGDVLVGGDSVTATSNSAKTYSKTGFGIISANDEHLGGIRLNSSTTNSMIIQADPDAARTNSFISFEIDGNEDMRINSSGNVGIGTTSPSAPLTVSKSTGYTEVTVASGGQEIDLFTNSTGSTCGLLTASNIPIIFYNNSTERMRIDSSGNVGIGLTNPSAVLETFGGTSFIGAKFKGYSGGKTALVGGDTSTIWFGDDDGSIGTTNNFNIEGASNVAKIVTNSSERMRIDSSGNVGIGTSSVSASRMQIKGANNNTAAFADGLKVTSNNETVEMQYSWAGMNANDSIKFGTGGSERMRITSDGKVWIGSSNVTQLGSHFVVVDGSDVLGVYASTISAGVVLQTNKGGANGTDSTTTYLSMQRPDGTVRGTITATGTSGVVYGTTSDYRLKENVKTLENGLDRLKQLKPVEFNWIETKEKEEGFIAHEIEKVFPYAVNGKKDDEKMQSVDYGRITPLLVKAIQEQQAQIEALQSEINLLKGE